MASNARFKIRRSTTYAGTVPAIPAAVGELIHITTNPNNYLTQVGHKVYVGVGTETAGQASGFESIGGQYYTQLLDGVAGILAPSAAIITDANSRVSGLNIASAGTLTLNNTANTFNTTLRAAPSLAASYALTLPATVGTAGQSLLTDGTGVLSWGTTSNNSNTTIPLNIASAYLLADTGANQYLKIDTTTGASAVTIGNIISSQNNVVKPNIAGAYTISDGTNNYFKVDTTTATPLVTLGFGNVVVSNTLNVNSGTIATTASSANLFNTNVSTLAIGGATGFITLGGAATIVTIGSIALTTGTLTTAAATASIVNTGATTVNFAGSSTTTSISAATGTTTINNVLALPSGNISTTATTASLFNTGATTLNLGGAATTVSIGAATGTTTINNNVVISGNLTINGSSELLNATNLSVQDSLIEMGRINNAVPTAATSFDLGLKMNYFDTVAKAASLFWQRSGGRFVLAKTATESSNVLTVATPTISNTDYADIVLGGVYVNDSACSVLGVAEPVISYSTVNGVTGRFINNCILDAGIF